MSHKNNEKNDKEKPSNESESVPQKTDQSDTVIPPVKPFEDDPELKDLYREIERGVKENLGMTSKQQLDRLSRPGSSYFNINPYDVLQCDFTATMLEFKKRFKMLSLLVHPDKNPNDIERAQKAFEVVGKAYKTIQNDEGYRRCQEVVEEAKRIVNQGIEEKRRKLRRGVSFGGSMIPEDNPVVYQTTVHKQMCKLFADLERLRHEKEVKSQVDKTKEAQKEKINIESLRRENEWKINNEMSRSLRINSWHEWKSKSKNKRLKMLRPPTQQMEERK